jgi:hypothetical protein
MKPMESEKKNSKSSIFWINMSQKPERTFAVCVKNDGYDASLEVRKIYEIIEDKKASDMNFVRVLDESGEDYLYPTEFFLPIDLPQDIAQALDKAA